MIDPKWSGQQAGKAEWLSMAISEPERDLDHPRGAAR
jgi:hypothetical protein